MVMMIEEAIRDLVYLKECSIFPFSYVGLLFAASLFNCKC